MHFLPDTSEADGQAERYWTDEFKKVIRREVEPAVQMELNEETCSHIYEQKFRKTYVTLEGFLNRMATLVAIGAENGADDAFEAVYQSFLHETPLPALYGYATYLWPQIFSDRLKEKIRAAIVEEYAGEVSFQYAYRAGYTRAYGDYAEFITEVSRLIVAGAVKGADDMLASIYRAFLANRDLPPGRRNPKRLKDW